ncbi:hypothetical protein KJ611_00365 [Patescibacteria group bacterium]|nr:hypothetical protein [Patescibacteria group bacterium]MBU1705200.1 hypothetical protein [Patescibacteria group bacterium]
MPAKTSSAPKGMYSLKTLLTKSWGAYRENFTKILYITLAVYIPLNIILYFTPTPNFDDLSDFTTLFRWESFLELILGTVATLAVASVVKAWIDKSGKAGSGSSGKEIEWTEAIKNILPVWPKAIWIQIVSGIIISLATILLILPGIFMAVSYLFVIHALLFREKTGLDALHYSYQLVKGRWWRTFGLTLVIGIFTFIASWLPDIIYIVVPAHYVTDIVTMTAADVIYAFSTVAFVVMFLNYEAVKAPVKK